MAKAPTTHYVSLDTLIPITVSEETNEQTIHEMARGKLISWLENKEILEFTTVTIEEAFPWEEENNSAEL